MQHYLQTVIDYFGAHTTPDRDKHEGDRAGERVLASLVASPLVVWLGERYAPSHEHGGWLLALILFTYGALSAAYYGYLRVKPNGGVWIQYTFLVGDPLMTLAVIAFEPRVTSWFSVLLLVEVARCGMRFGLRALMLEWGVASAGAALMLWNPTAFERSPNAALSVASLLGVGVPLFIPLVRVLHRSRELDLERTKIEAMAENLSARREFLSQVSHELRSPLQSILSSLDVLELRHEKPEDLELVQRVRRAASQLATQLGDLLTLARSEAGSLSLRPKRVDVRAAFAELGEEAREAAQAKGLQLVMDLPRASVTAVVDMVRLSQIAENLVTNAIKYTEQGVVTVHLEEFDEQEGVIRFSVEDTGVGIAPEDRLVIFAPYERAKAQAYARDSAGIGLAVVWALLAHMGGKVTVTSEVGVGSTFKVEVAASGPAKPLAEESEGCILVIDDRQDVLGSLVEVIAELGYGAESALTAGAASNLLASRTYDAVFFDLQMPVKSGAELATEIRRGDGPNRGTRFIAMTAADESDAGRQWPFDDFVRKPIAARRLKRLLAAPIPSRVPRR